MKTFRIVLFERIDGEEGHGRPIEIGEFQTESEVVPTDAFLAAMRVVEDVNDETEMENLLRQATAEPRDFVSRVLLRLYDDPFRRKDPPAWRSGVLTAIDQLEAIDHAFWLAERGR